MRERSRVLPPDALERWWTQRSKSMLDLKTPNSQSEKLGVGFCVATPSKDAEELGSAARREAAGPEAADAEVAGWARLAESGVRIASRRLPFPKNRQT